MNRQQAKQLGEYIGMAICSLMIALIIHAMFIAIANLALWLSN
jgi:hypothetical protein